MFPDPRKGKIMCSMNIDFAAESDSTEVIFSEYLEVLREVVRKIKHVLSNSR